MHLKYARETNGKPPKHLVLLNEPFTGRLRVTDFRKVGSWQLAVGSWQLAVGSWQLAVGSWQLAVGSWQLAVLRMKIK
jgi:hypothetical protein